MVAQEENRGVIPRTIFTDLQVATVGMTYKAQPLYEISRD